MQSYYHPQESGVKPQPSTLTCLLYADFERNPNYRRALRMQHFFVQAAQLLELDSAISVHRLRVFGNSQKAC
jgi:hypothetical protein